MTRLGDRFRAVEEFFREQEASTQEPGGVPPTNGETDMTDTPKEQPSKASDLFAEAQDLMRQAVEMATGQGDQWGGGAGRIGETERELRAQVAHLQDEVRDLQGEVKAAVDSLTAANVKLTVAEGAMTSATEAIAALQAQNEELTRVTDELTSDISTQCETNQRLRAALERTAVQAMDLYDDANEALADEGSDDEEDTP